MAQAKPQDIVELLTQDHREVEQLFEQFEQASDDSAKQEVALEICRQLTIHATLEEDVFYPACEGKIDQALLNEALVEHDTAKVLIAEIEAGQPSDEFYAAKVKVLKEGIEHHIAEEEQESGSLFHEARRAGVDVEALGALYVSRKAQLIEAAATDGLPDPEMTTFEKTQV